MQVLVAGFPVARAGRRLDLGMSKALTLSLAAPPLPALVLLRLLLRETIPLGGVSQPSSCLFRSSDSGALRDAKRGIGRGEDEAPCEYQGREDQKRGTEVGNFVEHGWQDSGYSEQRRNPQRIRPGVSDTESELRQQ